MKLKAFRALTPFEKVWFLAFSVVITAATLYFSATGTDWGDPKAILLNWVASPVSAITGIITVILTARGNIYNYLFGIINSIAYGLIAWVTGYYGDWILNWFFFVPTQFLILLVWRRHMRPDNPVIVRMKTLSLWQIVLTVGLSAAAFVAFGILLSGVDSWFVNYWKRSASIYSTIARWSGLLLLGPLFDSSTEVFQIFAQILCIRRYAEQWIFWILTDIFTIVMWLAVVMTDRSSLPMSLPTLIMWCAFLVNAIYGAFVWYRGAENRKGAAPTASRQPATAPDASRPTAARPPAAAPGAGL